jgi:nucleotide-binding universal stress UspA family protein
MRDVSSTLTIVHVHDPELTRTAEAARQLRTFFIAADRQPLTHRVLLSGNDPAKAIADYLARHPHDLVVCPARAATTTADARNASKSAAQPSVRARLLVDTDTALLTAKNHPATPVLRVGCILSRRDSIRPFEMASAYAHRVGATAQLLYVVEDMHDVRTRDGLTVSDFQRLAPSLPVPTEVHAVVGHEAQHILSLLEHARPDILFVEKRDSIRRTPWAFEMLCYVDDAGCPVVCVDSDRTLPCWKLRGRSETARANLCA